jgi:hypothetical protein
MAEYKISIEGQMIPVPEEIGADDEKVKKSLTPYWPDAANALITRTEKDGVITVNVIKKAGTKGGAPVPIQRLLACEQRKNPAIALYEELGQEHPDGMTAEDALEMNARIERAIEAGLAENRRLEEALRRLEQAQPIPAPEVVMGF